MNSAESRLQAIIALHAERPAVAMFLDHKHAELVQLALDTLPQPLPIDRSSDGD